MSAHHGRRKSLAFLSRPSSLFELDSENNTAKPRPKSALFSSNSGGLQEVSAIVSSSTPPRPKILAKTPPQRPKSMFGSYKARDPTSPKAESSASSSAASSHELPERYVYPASKVVLHSGEVVAGTGLLRKKREYIVLTSQELLKFKSEHKANEAFGLGTDRRSGGRVPSVASFGEIGVEHSLVTMLDQVVAVYGTCTSGDYEQSSMVQIDYLEEPSGAPGSTSFQASSPAEAQKWVDQLRGAVRQAQPQPAFSEPTIEYIARRLEADRDYSPMHFRIFCVVQRSGKPSNRSGSSEDLQRLYSTVCYLAIGIHKVHLVPLPKPQSKSTASLLSSGNSYGILTLTGMWVSDCDDCFSLTFRYPCRPQQKVHLASADAATIIQGVRQVSDYLRPQWQFPPFHVNIPESMKDEPIPVIPTTPGDDFNGFDRTLAAYCTAYDLDASNIVYGIHTNVEDEPRFVLYPPAYTRRRHYTDLELLAIMRSLRWNECFGSISFRSISLDPLNSIYDHQGIECEPRCDRSGRPVNLRTTPGLKSLLIHELRSLALYSGKLRRMDFFECVKRSNYTILTPDGSISDRACGIVEAIMPLCRRGLTNVDWFVFTGIEMGESDLDWLVDAAASRLAHFRGFEVARCGLTERMLTLFLNALTTHENTLESLDLCGNPGRIHSPSLNNTMSYFPFLRKLNLSRLLRASGEDALLTAETLLRWRLEELDLSETKLNTETVDAVATYLASQQSDSLHRLALTQCSLTSKDVAVFMYAMVRPGKVRDMHLYIGQNPLAQHHDKLVDCIAGGITPSYLTMRMVDYPREEMFQDLARALKTNTTLIFLDISKISLPYEAGEETCKELGNLFAENTTLKELDISGEQAVLESARLGPGLAKALARLADNNTLEVLRIELQSLGQPGAMELASMLVKNTGLRELYCEMNDIHLQGFTAIVNAIECNQTLVYMPRMDRDRAEHVRYLKERLFQPSGAADDRKALKKEGKRASRPSLRKSSGKLGKKVAFTEEVLGMSGVEASLMVLEEKWESEAQRLHVALARNVGRLHEGQLGGRFGGYLGLS